MELIYLFIMISLERIEIKYGERELLKDVSFLVNQKDRIGLVGKNGSGKSTLLKIITGEIKPHEGKVVIPSDVNLGYLPQYMNYEDSTSILNETGKAFKEINKIQKEVQDLNQKVTDATDYESEIYLGWLNKLSLLNERLHMFDVNTRDEKIEQCLTGLGFKRVDFHRNTSELSGGWRMRIELAKILLQNPEVLLLDEPTNHLDIESIQWLEGFLKDYYGAVVIISHDRAFLDNITNRTIEISMGQIFDYKVSYSSFVHLKKERHEQQMAAYRNQQKMIDDTEKFIEKFRYKATKAVQVQSRIKQLNKLERIEVDQEDQTAIKIKFPPALRSGRVVVEAHNIVKKYDDLLVLNNIDMVIERGEKVAFVGKNGEGKTTMSRIIMGEIDYHGHLKTGHNVQTGYYAQNHDAILNKNISVFETVDAIAVGNIRTQLRDILGAFLFSGEDVDKKVKVLSGGERSRLALVKLLLEPYNLLLLDEPTNHLDMFSKDILKEALKQYDGTLIIVSHDRYFLDGLVDKIYEFENHKIKEHLGGIYDFLKRKNMNSLKEIEIKGDGLKEIKPNESSKDSKADYLERKEHDRKLRKIKKEIEECEKKINGYENELESFDHIMSNPEELEKEKNQDIYARYDNIKKLLDEEMNKWENLHINLEDVEHNKN